MIYVFLHCYQDNDYIAVLKVFGVFMKVMMMRIDRDGWPWPKQQVRVEVCLALSIGENEETKERRTERRTEATAIIRPISHESDSF